MMPTHSSPQLLLFPLRQLFFRSNCFPSRTCCRISSLTSMRGSETTTTPIAAATTARRRQRPRTTISPQQYNSRWFGTDHNNNATADVGAVDGATFPQQFDTTTNSTTISSSTSASWNIRGTMPNCCCDGVSSSLEVGQYAEQTRSYSASDVQQFGRLVGDCNPLHQAWNRNATTLPSVLIDHPLLRPRTGTDHCAAHGGSKNSNGQEEETSTSSKEEGEPTSSSTNTATATTPIVVQGVLVGSIFSAILGTLLPGAVYLKQRLDFRQPVYVGERVTGRITIQRVREWKRNGIILTCDTVVLSSSSSCNSEVDVKIRGQADVWLPKGIGPAMS
jgi:acyl dehydratase